MGTDEKARRSENGRKSHDRGEGLTNDASGGVEILCADAVRRLHRKPHDRGAADAVEKPERRAHEPDRRRIRCAEVPHHRSVDVLHQDIGDLSERCRDRKPGDKFELVAHAELSPASERL